MPARSLAGLVRIRSAGLRDSVILLFPQNKLRLAVINFAVTEALNK